GARPNETQTLWIYIGATVAIVILTAIYTTLGGIKAVIWTDLIQASIMIGSAVAALALLYFAIPGGWHEIVQRRGDFHFSDLIAIAFTFVSIGLLLWVYYQAHPDPTLPKSPNETFCHFILYQMPVGVRGLLLAGIFATAMGSLSTALNALATSFTRDWYEPYINPGSTSAQSLRAVRWATVAFAMLMIVVASTTSYLVIVHPNVRIIPIVLGIFGYTYG